MNSPAAAGWVVGQPQRVALINVLSNKVLYPIILVDYDYFIHICILSITV